MKNLTHHLLNKPCLFPLRKLREEELKSLINSVLKRVARASGEFKLIEKNDRILLALSGGKDSWTLLHFLIEIRKKAPFPFEIFVVVVDQGFEGFNTSIIERKLSQMSVDGYEILKTNIYRTVLEKNQRNKIFCSLCSRLRRGILYSYGREGGFNKLALGHHMDDVVETLLLNIFFSGKLAGMAPRRVSDDGKMIVIRPLYYVQEKETSLLAHHLGYPVVCCRCPLCEDKETSMRKFVKNLLFQLEEKQPGIKLSLLRSLSNPDLKSFPFYEKIMGMKTRSVS